MKTLIAFSALILLASSTVTKKWHKSGDGSLYFIEAEQKYNWYQAWNECARKNMSLIAIDTYERHYQIDVLVKELFPTCPSFWLAGHDNAVDTRYEWATTGEVFTFNNWGSGQPGAHQMNIASCCGPLGTGMICRALTNWDLFVRQIDVLEVTPRIWVF